MILLADAVIKSSIVLIAALVALWILRRSSAAMRHYILAAGLACAALVPVLSAALPGWGTAVAPPMVRTASPQSSSRVTTAVMPVSPGAAAGAESRPPVAGALLSGQHILRVWASGALSALLLLAVGFARLTWIARGARPADDGWRDALMEVARRYRLARLPRLLASGHPSLLVTWGALRPTVLLPAPASGWSPDRVQVVLDHELAHIARRDWIVQILAELVRCVYWFNPLVWIACRRLRQESEQACDDLVLGTGLAGTTYAAHLLDLARALRTPDRLWVPAAAISRPSSLERRVAAMLTKGLNREPVGRHAGFAAVLAVLVVAVPVASFDALAQNRFSTVSGVVSDESGAAVGDVRLSLTDVQTKAKFEVRSNQTGFYEFGALPAAEYEMEVQRAGFDVVSEPLAVGVGESRQKNLSLRVGQVQETVTVLAGAGPKTVEVARHSIAARRCANPAVGGCIDPPKKVKDVRPVYPPSLENTGLEGQVEIQSVIGTDGRMKEMQVISSPHPDFDRAALDAVGQWEFTPTTLNGMTIETRMNVRVGFSASPRVP